MKRIVIPGELISAERKRLGSNVYVANGKIYSKVIGVSNDEGEYANVVPLEGQYDPKRNDVVIGVVIRVVHAGYEVDLNGPYTSFIPRGAFRDDDLKEGETISGKIAFIKENGEPEIDFPRRIFGGEMIEVSPVKVPRMIGKNASMLEILKEGTGSSVIIGKNGRIWFKGGDTVLLRKAIKFIEENSHKSNLTNAVQEMLGNKELGDE